MNWELALSIIVILLSVYNFLYNVITKWTRLDIDVNYYEPTKINGKNFLYLLVTFINKSNLPITINKAYLHIDGKRYLCNINKQCIGNVLDISFPEFKSFFNNKFSATSLYILNKYKTAEKIANMKDFDSLRKISRGKFSYPRFLKLKELSKDSIGTDNELFTLQLQTFLNLYFHIDEQISLLEDKINDIIKELNPQFLSIKGIGSVTCAAIISEFGDISRFKSADAMVAFAGLDCSIIQSGTSEHYGKMVKHGSSHLRYHLMKAAEYVFMHEPIFTVYYYKKRDEGKSHRVTLNHVAKKLIRIIYKLETENIPFDRSKLR